VSLYSSILEITKAHLLIAFKPPKEQLIGYLVHSASCPSDCLHLHPSSNPPTRALSYLSDSCGQRAADRPSRPFDTYRAVLHPHPSVDQPRMPAAISDYLRPESGGRAFGAVLEAVLQIKSLPFGIDVRHNIE